MRASKGIRGSVSSPNWSGCGRSMRSSATGSGLRGFWCVEACRLPPSVGDAASGAAGAWGFRVFQGRFAMAQVESRARATSDPEARGEALKRLQDENVDFLLLWFTDIEGHLKSFAVTPSEVEEALNDGMGFDGSSITGFNAIEESDMVAIPDPSTFQLMPAREGEMKMARMICDIVTPDGKPYEGDMRFAPALEMADHTVTYRLIVKEIAKKAGYHATFMPKPIFGENGSGMHTHQSLFSDGRNAFFDGDDQWHLSAAGKAFIAGQLRHAREIAAIFAQWVNSYKRLVPGYEAPVYVAWSQRNRSALIRIPLYKPGAEQATRAEIRCPDPACNPYLTFAALLHAGLEGIEQGYELPEPMETNLYHLTAEQRKERGIVSLPETLGEAVDALAGSELVRKALGPHIFDRYVELKRAEWDEYRVQLTEWEMKKYLPVL